MLDYYKRSEYAVQIRWNSQVKVSQQGPHKEPIFRRLHGMDT